MQTTAYRLRSKVTRFNDADWLSFCIKNGFIRGSESVQDLYEFHGRVLHDQELTEKALDKYLVHNFLDGDARFKVMKAMSATELAELRERVSVKNVGQQEN